VRITVLYDNNVVREKLHPAHGFSVLVENKKFSLLFDTGWSGPILLENARTLGKDLKQVRFIFLSHQHWDHIGGLPDVLKEIQREVIFIVPRSFTKGFKRELSHYGEVMEADSSVFEFAPGFFSTGEMDSDIGIKEQALFIKGKKDVLIVGCSHPDVYRMINLVGKVDILMGGFHGFERIELLGDVVGERIFPCHCTVKKDEILDMYTEKSQKCGAGLEVEI